MNSVTLVEEAELVTDIQAGSDLSFDYLVTYYHSSVYNLVYGILSDTGDAADVTQEVFLRVFRGIRGFRRSSSLKTCIYRVAVRQALNHRRWRWRHHRQQFSIDTEEEGSRKALELQDGEGMPFEQGAEQEVQASVRRALAAVPTQFRSAVILRDLEGLSRRGCGSSQSYRSNREIAHFAWPADPERTSRSAGTAESV